MSLESPEDLRWGGALGFAGITTPIIQTVDKYKATCSRLHQVMICFYFSLTLADSNHSRKFSATILAPCPCHTHITPSRKSYFV